MRDGRGVSWAKLGVGYPGRWNGRAWPSRESLTSSLSGDGVRKDRSARRSRMAAAPRLPLPSQDAGLSGSERYSYRVYCAAGRPAAQYTR